MRFTISTIALGFAAVASAVTPTTMLTTQLAIGKPGLAEIVPAGKPYTITWANDYLPNQPVEILLLHGPSENVVPFGAPLAVSAPNSGSFVWDVSTSIPPESTHYGLQIIAADGKYQFSVQFGISNPGFSSSSSVSASASATAASSGSVYVSKSASAAAVSTSPCSTSIYTSANATSVKPTGTGYSSHFTASTGYPVSNSSIVLPSKSMTVPSSLLTTAVATGAQSSAAASAATTAAQATGAAGHVKAGLGLAGAIAGLVMVL